MIIDDRIINELQTDDGHMGEISFLPEVTALSRREGTIEILKRMGAANIIHIGCCGHFHNIKRQMENNSHFHALLIQNFKKVIGFDIEEKAIKYLTSFGINDIYAKNFVEDVTEVDKIICEKFGNEPYIVLLPEVLEHIANPVQFLEKIKAHHGKDENKILISVPNAYGFGRVWDALFHNRESINMDHKYMFTPTTILKVMCMSGIIPEEIQFFDLYKYSRIFKKPFLGNTIVTVGRFGN
ncbi:hypothetical protein IMSAG249_02154 [Lachnospiraceae bacterium]|jgi:2-polyprenyl-3-methyl-5-hydroxy-6-metoxy-1,4-benzoquinol methylase|nr:hypothetical protein IMSAGC009_03145 [Lachnospiraceae bacterium]GFI70325.1 hypothetical protein IMSAG249_02154 [Lachnospiraceae bacterium]